MVAAEIADQSRLTAPVGGNACHDDERLACGCGADPLGPRSRCAIPIRQPLRRHSGEEERLEHHVLRAPPPPAVALPSPRRRNYRLRRVIQLASPAKPTHEVDVLHQWPLAVAADRVEYVATNE